MTSANVSNVPVQFGVSTTQSAKTNSSDTKTDFMNVMNQSVGNKASTQMQNPKYHANDVKTVDKADAISKESYQANSGRNDIKSSDSTNTVDKETKDQVTESVNDFADEVNSTLKEELGVSDEDIEGAMETLGLTYMDLINPANMTQLVTQLTGSENAVELLMNPNFSNVLDNLQALTGNLLEETNMTLGELTDVINQMNMSQMSEEGIPLQDIPMESIPENQGDVPVEKLQSNSDETASIQNVTEEQTLVQNNGQLVQDNQAIEDNKNLSSTDEGTTTETKVTIEVTETKEQSSENQTDAKDSQRNSSNLLNQENSQMNMNTLSAQDTTYNPVTETVTNPAGYVTDVNSIMEQIVQAAKVSISLGETTMEMILNPESLGKLYMQVSEKEGSVSAKLYTQNEAVKEALESQMVQLKENLNQQGVKVDSVEVSVGTHEFERNLEQDAKREEQQAEEMERQASSTRSRNINLNSLDDLQGLMTEEEELAAKIMRDNGNTVNYTA